MTGRQNYGRSLWSGMAKLCLTLGLATLTLTGSAGDGAARTFERPGGVFVVEADNGGLVNSRIQEIAHLRRSATRVEIRGDRCISACTMYLGLEQTCIWPDTVFGFHGPSAWGLPLGKRGFDNTVAVIASHYPAGALRDWYRNVASKRIYGSYKIPGRHLIALGAARSCAAGNR